MEGYLPNIDSSHPLNGPQYHFTYNGLDQLTQITDGSNNVIGRYKYNASGLRAEKTTEEGTTQYDYDHTGRTIAETDQNGNIKAQIVWGHKPLVRKTDGKYYYYVYNGHGDVVQMVDENGNIVNSYKYDEWGNITEKQETIENPIRYAGEYYDEESGLYYLRARYYDPVIGRFITKDSYEGQLTNPLTLNQYTYCLNNPLIYVDPSGNNAEQVRAFLMGLVHAIDDGFFFGGASKLTGNTPEGWQNSTYTKEFNEAYTAGKITNQIYGLLNISSGLKNLISNGELVINGAGELVSAGTGEVVGAFKAIKGTIVFSLSNKGESKTGHGNQRANERGFSDEKIQDIKNNYSQKVYQSEGRTVYAKKNGNYYDVVIYNREGEVITTVGGNTKSLKTWKDVTKMLNNNGGYSSLPWD